MPLRSYGCQRDIYPLDQAIGLGSGKRMALGMRGWSLLGLVEVRYEMATQFFRNSLAWELNGSKKVRHMALEERRRIEKWERENIHEIYQLW